MPSLRGMGLSNLGRIGIAIFGLAQAGLIGVSTLAGSLLLLALGELGLISLAAGLALLGKYVALRIRYTEQRSRYMRQAERSRIVDDLHDMVGHELSLIAMQAGLLQLRTKDAEAEIAGELRSRAEAAVKALHDSLDLISDSSAVHHPVGQTPTALVEQSRAVGAKISLRGSLDGVSATTGLVATSVLREALTNAARHAPGRPVDVVLSRNRDDVVVSIVTHQAVPMRSAPEGRGLAAMRARLDAVGGALKVDHDERGHVVVARIPPHARYEAPATREPPGGRPLSRLARAAAIPVVVVVTVSVGFYAWASNGVTVEPENQSRLRVGTSAVAAQALLPDRQARIRLIGRPAHPSGWDCRVYTDGNFPMAVATLEVCFLDGAVVRITNLAARPLW